MAWSVYEGLRVKFDGSPTEQFCRDVTDSNEEGNELWQTENSRRQDANFRSSRQGNFQPLMGP